MDVKKSSLLMSFASIILEWCEFSIFLYTSTIISKLFFSDKSGDLSYIYTMAIFLVSYVARPVGAIIFGYISDTKGRRLSMLFSSFLMTIGTISIGLLPIYEQIGLLAPLFLLVFRIMQGLAIGIEFNNSINFILEHTSKNKILASGFISAATSGGMCLGALFVSRIDFSFHPDMWRVPYIVLGIISFLILILRKKMHESPEFNLIKENNQIVKNPIFAVFKFQSRKILVIFSLSAFIGVFVYSGHVYLMSFLVRYAGFTMQSTSDIAFFIQASLTILVPLFSFLLSRYNLKKIFFTVGTLALGAVCPFLFIAGSKGPDNISDLYILLALYVLFNSAYSSYVFYYMYRLLPTNVRCSGSGFAYGMASALFGGTAPIISDKLVKMTYNFAPGVYIFIVGVLTYLIGRKSLDE